MALDRNTGRELWRRTAPTSRLEPQHQIGSPASVTVASDGERVYVLFGSTGVLAFDMKGKQLWRQGVGKENAAMRQRRNEWFMVRPDVRRLIPMSYDAPITTEYWDDDASPQYARMFARIQREGVVLLKK